MIIGFPRMDTIQGLKRDFPPVFVRSIMANNNVTVLLETDYGTDLGYTNKQYAGGKTQFANRGEVFSSSDLIIVLTAPSDSDIKKMKKGAILLSMLHYATHPKRNLIIKKAGVRAISLDSLTDGFGKRIVQDYQRTASHGVSEGYRILIKQKGKKWWYDPLREPIKIVILGFGGVGKEAAYAAMQMGSKDRMQDLLEKGGNPIVNILPFGRIQTSYHKLFDYLFVSQSSRTIGTPHIIIDATKRSDFSKPIFANQLLSYLPKETVIVDLAADQYDGHGVVKGIHGIPTGSEKQWIFESDDPAWEDPELTPKIYQIPPEYRRTVVSHYSWPSFGGKENRRKNMMVYSTQIYPFVQSIIDEQNQIKQSDIKKTFWNREQSIIDAQLENYKPEGGLL